MKKNRMTAILLASVLLASTALSGCTGSREGGEETKRTAEETNEKPDKPGKDDRRETEKETKEEENKGDEKETQDSESPKHQEPIEAPHMTREEYPVVDGSTATIPLSTALYQLVTGASPEEAEKAVDHSKTTASYVRLIYGEADLVIAYEPAKSINDVIRQTGQDVIIKPIGKDALVFMANEGNPVTSLSGSQLTQIYSGKYKDWSQVGGVGKEIIAFQRPQGSGSQTLMEKLVMKGLPMADAPQTRVVGEMGELIEQVASYNNEENALGYSVYFYAQNMYQKPGLRFMAVDGVMPDKETIKEGTYPYVNEFYAAIREDEPEDSPAYRLFQWLTTEDGQALVESVGYVGVGQAKQVWVDTQTMENPAPGTVALKESSGVLLDGDFAEGTGGVLVLGPDLSERGRITDKKINSSVVLLKEGEPVPMIDEAGEKMGLYDVEKGRWALEPVYDYITPQDDGTMYGYRDGQTCRIFWNEEARSYEDCPGLFQRLGDYWWKEEGDTYQVYKGETFPGQGAIPEKLLDFSQRPFSYGYTDQDCYVMTFQDQRKEIYSQDGTLLFGEETLGRPVKVYGFSPQWVWISEMEEGQEESYIYHLATGRQVTEPGDQIEGINTDEGRGYFCVVRDGEKIICGEDGQPVLSASGKTFDRLVGKGFLARWEDGTLQVEKPSAGETYQISCPENYDAAMVTGNVFYVYDSQWNEAKGYIYQGDRCIMEGEYPYWTEYDGFFVIGTQDNQTATDSRGQVLYETDGTEAIMGVYPEILTIRRGNYLCVTDYEGTCGFRTLLGYMTDD